MNSHICQKCNIKFKDKRKVAKFCSYDCYYKSMVGSVHLYRRKRVNKDCVVCGKSFEINTCHNNVKTCSVKCGGISRRGKKWILKDRIEITCVCCNKKVEVLPYLKNKQFCNRKCYLEFKSRDVTHPDKQRFQGSNWMKIREKVKIRDKKCTECGRAGNEVHHIIPYSISGDDSLDNLTLLCKSCHLKIHRKMWNTKKLTNK